MVAEHVNGLVSELDSYAAGDYAGAYLTVGASYRHMFDMGKALAAGIATQFPDRFATVTSLPATDTAGSTAVTAAPEWWPSVHLS
jgi:hypothetical protein